MRAVVAAALATTAADGALAARGVAAAPAEQDWARSGGQHCRAELWLGSAAYGDELRG
eukprot:gene18880-6660_t